MLEDMAGENKIEGVVLCRQRKRLSNRIPAPKLLFYVKRTLLIVTSVPLFLRRLLHIRDITLCGGKDLRL